MTPSSGAEREAPSAPPGRKDEHGHAVPLGDRSEGANALIMAVYPVAEGGAETTPSLRGG